MQWRSVLEVSEDGAGRHNARIFIKLSSLRSTASKNEREKKTLDTSDDARDFHFHIFITH